MTPTVVEPHSSTTAARVHPFSQHGHRHFAYFPLDLASDTLGHVVQLEAPLVGDASVVKFRGVVGVRVRTSGGVCVGGGGGQPLPSSFTDRYLHFRREEHVNSVAILPSAIIFALKT